VDFEEGAGALLDNGIDPNTNGNVFAFNVALVNQDDAVEGQILKAGYRIEANYKQCMSSKNILNKKPASISNGVTMAIQRPSVMPTFEHVTGVLCARSPHRQRVPRRTR
jgi:hypothetical protein